MTVIGLLDMFVIVCIAFQAFAAPPSALVKNLPGWDGPLPSSHYSGYIAVADGTKMLHYYLQEADTSPETKPLVLWMNGGPGASSFIGAFTELGQLIFNKDSITRTNMSDGNADVPKLFRNPYSWTTVANLLYLEAPAGVGFSYCTDPQSKCSNNDNSTASDNHEFLVGFLKAFPEYANRPLYLTGESYAGIYLPTLMNEIIRQGVIKTVKGIAIGNGCWGTVSGTNCGDVRGTPGTVYKIDAEYYAGRGLISSKLKAAADKACGDWADPLSKDCRAAYHDISTALGRFNIDNVDDFCPSESSTLMTLADYRELSFQQRLRRRYRDESHPAGDANSVTPTIGDVQMWCGAESALYRWRKDQAVVAALHVQPLPHNFDYDIQPLDLRPLYRTLAGMSSLKFTIYNGQSDANVPWNGQVDYWAEDDTVLTEWAPWIRHGPKAATAGHVRTYQTSTGTKFNFVTISGAGHEVPTYRPSAALTMLTDYILN